MSSGAYRGYGATQGIFAVESAVNELAAALHMDPVALREKNMVKEGDVMPVSYTHLDVYKRQVLMRNPPPEPPTVRWPVICINTNRNGVGIYLNRDTA